jgi:hypothetical protein
MAPFGFRRLERSSGVSYPAAPEQPEQERSSDLGLHEYVFGLTNGCQQAVRRISL